MPSSRPAGAETARIRRFRVLADGWAPGGALVTPTLELRRAAIEARYAAEIAELYA